jgi:hypothetical protein
VFNKDRVRRFEHRVGNRRAKRLFPFLFLFMPTNIAQRKVQDIAEYRSDRGNEIADRLLSVATENGSLVASAVAFRLQQCADKENLFVGSDMHKNDECFDATGNLFACGSRLCDSCNANRSREMRRRGRAAIQKLGSGSRDLRWRSLVLTMPLMKGASVNEAIDRINDAFRRMTNRKFWKTRVKGGIKSVEFTVRADGYHVHIHLLILSEHIPVNREIQRRFARLEARRKLFSGNLSDELAHCLKAAGAEISGSPVCAVFDVRNRNLKSSGNREISLEKALQETCKYLTKSESWDKIPDSSLVEIAEVTRWKRMFELLGEARNGNSADVMDGITESDSKHSLVHTKTLSNGDKLPTWREALKSMSFAGWKREMIRRIRLIRAFRKEQLSESFEFASFRLLSGQTFGLESAA